MVHVRNRTNHHHQHADTCHDIKLYPLIWSANPGGHTTPSPLEVDSNPSQSGSVSLFDWVTTVVLKKMIMMTAMQGNDLYISTLSLSSAYAFIRGFGSATCYVRDSKRNNATQWLSAESMCTLICLDLSVTCDHHLADDVIVDERESGKVGRKVGVFS